MLDSLPTPKRFSTLQTVRPARILSICMLSAEADNSSLVEDALASSLRDALCLQTARPRTLSHCLVIAFEPNSAWKFGDSDLSRFNLVAAAAQPKADVLQYLRWGSFACTEDKLREATFFEETPQEVLESGSAFAGRLLLFQISKNPRAKWDIQGILFTVAMLPEGVHKLLESTDGWLERLRAELTPGGGGGEAH